MVASLLVSCKGILSCIPAHRLLFCQTAELTIFHTFLMSHIQINVAVLQVSFNRHFISANCITAGGQSRSHVRDPFVRRWQSRDY